MIYVSISQVINYIGCSLRYRYTYIDKLPKPYKSSSLVLGSAVHASLEWLHRSWKAKREVKKEELIGAFLWNLRKETQGSVLYKEGESKDELEETGRMMLDLYYDTVIPITPVEIELPFEIVLNLNFPEKVVLKGVIDLIEEGDVIVDIKTSSKSMDGESIDKDLQLTTYSYAFRRLYKRQEKLLRVDNLIRGKTPKFGRIETNRTEQDHKRLLSTVEKILKAIKEEIFFPNPSWLCADCEYREPCSKWEGV